MTDKSPKIQVQKPVHSSTTNQKIVVNIGESSAARKGQHTSSCESVTVFSKEDGGIKLELEESVMKKGADVSSKTSQSEQKAVMKESIQENEGSVEDLATKKTKTPTKTGVRKRTEPVSPEQSQNSSSSPSSPSADEHPVKRKLQTTSSQAGNSEKGSKSPRGAFVPNYEPIQTRKRAKTSQGASGQSPESGLVTDSTNPKSPVQKAPRQRLRKDEVYMPDVGPRPKAVPKSLLILEPRLVARNIKKKQMQSQSAVQIHTSAAFPRDASGSRTSQPEDSNPVQAAMLQTSLLTETDTGESSNVKVTGIGEGGTLSLTVDSEACAGSFITVTDGHITAVEPMEEGQNLTAGVVASETDEKKSETPTSLLLLAEAAYPSTAGPHTLAVNSPAAQSPTKTITSLTTGVPSRDNQPAKPGVAYTKSVTVTSPTFVTVACKGGTSRIIASSANEDKRNSAVVSAAGIPPDQWMCTICGELIDKEEQQQHVTQHLDAEEEEDFMCETCGEQLRDEEDLELHMAVEHDEEEGEHDGDGDFEEEEEDENTTEETTDESQNVVTDTSTASPPAVVTTATGTPIHTCEQCGDTFPYAAYLRQHIKQAHSEAGTVLTCSLCPVTFASASQLENHSRLHQSVGSRITFKCVRCSQCFSSAALLSSHAKTCSTRVISDTVSTTPKRGRGRGQVRGHNRVRTSCHACTVCHKSFTSEVYLRAHQLSHQSAGDADSNLKVNQSVSGLQCLYCSEKFRHIGPLKEHIIASHPTAFPFKCSICQRGFSRDSSRITHEQTHQREKMHFCTECGEGFTLQNYLKRHMKYRHLKLTKLPCRVCNKEFVRQADLIKHMRVHTGEKPYTCEICGHGFGQQSNYRYHMMRHRGQKPHVCRLCNKGFRVPSHLKMHMQQHLNGRFSCQLCDKVFSQSRYLNRHMRTHANARRVGGTTLLPAPHPDSNCAMETVMVYDNTATQPIKTEQQIIVDSVGDVTEHVVVQDSSGEAEPVIQFIFNDKGEEQEEKRLAVVDAEGNTVLATPLDITTETPAGDMKVESSTAPQEEGTEAQAYVNADEGRSVVVGAFSEGEGGSMEEGNVTLPFRDLTQLLGGKHYNCDVCSESFSIQPNSTYNMIHTGQSHILVVSLNDHIHQEPSAS